VLSTDVPAARRAYARHMGIHALDLAPISGGPYVEASDWPVVVVPPKAPRS